MRWMLGAMALGVAGTASADPQVIELPEDAWAQRTYLGASYGTSRWDVGFQNGLSTHPDTQAKKVWLGHDLRFAALELGWTSLGQVIQQGPGGLEGRLLSRGIGIDVLFKLPLGSVEPFVKVGRLWARTEQKGPLFSTRLESYSTQDVQFGLGLNLKLGTHTMLRAEYGRYSMGNELGLGGVNAYTVGAAFRF